MKKKLAGIALLLSLVAALYSASMVVGEPARLVDVLLLFFSGMGAGAALTSYLRRLRREERHDAMPRGEVQS